MKEEPEQTNRPWFNVTNILIAIILLFLLVFIVWNQSISEKIYLAEEERALVMATSTPTAAANLLIPAEFYSEPADTSGIILAGIILLMIVFISSFWKIRKLKNK